MLLMGNADKIQRATYDRRKKEGAGLPSDVWSLGCLLFELLTGSYLFHAADWIQFFLRVTQPGQVWPVASHLNKHCLVFAKNTTLHRLIQI